MRIPCPSCPDGNEWNSNGPTGRACRICEGVAYIDDDDEDVAVEVEADREMLGDDADLFDGEIGNK